MYYSVIIAEALKQQAMFYSYCAQNTFASLIHVVAMCLVKIQNISNAVYYRLAVVSPYVGIGQKQKNSSNQCITRQDSQATKKTSVIITEKSCFTDVQTKILASLACCSCGLKIG